jgi:hypothetical protein
MSPRSTLARVVVLVGCLAWPSAVYAQDLSAPEGLWVSEPTEAGVSAQLRIPRGGEGARISIRNSAIAIPCPLALAAFPAPALVDVAIPGDARDGRISGTTLPAPTGGGPAGLEHNATLDLDLTMRPSPRDGHYPSLPSRNHWVGTIREHIIRTAPP